MFRLFGFLKEKEEVKEEFHNRLIDIRIGRKFARGQNMGGNANYCFDITAEEAYSQSIEKSDELKRVNKLYFTEGYNSQTEELHRIIHQGLKR